MSDPEAPGSRDEIQVSDMLRPLLGHGRYIVKSTAVTVALAAVLLGFYYVQQPAMRTAVLEFRPMFEGASAGRYPNGVPFAPTDIVAPSVIEQVYAKNNMVQFCPREVLQAGLVVQESSPGLQFLNLEYQARLSDVRLTAVERQRLQDEYAGRRASITRQYELRFVQPAECGSLPDAIIAKFLSELLETWAQEAEDKRGVLRLRVSVLTPAIFDPRGVDADNLLIRADLLRTGVSRVIANIREVEALPGSGMVRGSSKRVSLAEVRAELEDLIQARLDPLVAQAGRGLGREAARWIQQALQTATIRLRAAEQRAEAYRDALREYSGVTPVPQSPRTPGERPQSSDVQTLTPQIDRTFIDRIVELSAANTIFRQEITNKAIEASVEAVNRGAVVEQYKQLLSLMALDATTNVTSQSVGAVLTAVTAQAREATQRFNEIYEEFSKIALRVGPKLYHVEQPVFVYTLRSFGMRKLFTILVAIALVTPILLALLILVRSQLRKLVRGAR